MYVSEYYCRFCAVRKPDVHIIDFSRITSFRKYIIKVISFFNLHWFDLTAKHLPDTICDLCYLSFNAAFQFFNTIKTSQAILTDLLIDNLKQEASNHSYEDSTINIEQLKCEDSKIYINTKFDDDVSKIYQDVSIEDDRSWKLYPWICKACSKRFDNMVTLREHSKEVHNKCNNFQCADCDAHFNDFNSFIGHVRWHRESLILYCQYCNNKFQSDIDNINHVTLNHTGPQCIVCGEFFQNATELQNHIKIINNLLTSNTYKRHDQPITKDKLTCHVCGKEFKKLISLRIHMKLHENQSRNFICDICGKSFTFQGGLTVHNKSHVKSDPEICKICNKSYANLTKLKAHVKTHANKKFECDHCHKRFRNKCLLRNHIIVHMNVFPYNCPLCEKKFKFKSNLKSHIVIHTGARPFACSHCNRDFTNLANCNKHIRRKHGATLVKSKNIVFEEVDKRHKDIEKWTEELMKPVKRRKRKKRIATVQELEMRIQIITRYERGHSVGEISRQLHITKKTVGLWIKRYTEAGSLD